MTRNYYFDTSIWLDFFEDRDEPNMPKNKWARELISKIIEEDSKIIYTDVSYGELIEQGYTRHELNALFSPLKRILVYVEATKKEVGMARNQAKKKKVPKRDALHAFIARDHKAILVTLDNHFKKLLDITKPKKPQDLII